MPSANCKSGIKALAASDASYCFALYFQSRPRLSLKKTNQKITFIRKKLTQKTIFLHNPDEMKRLTAFLLVLFFLCEVVVDTSTCFVRIGTSSTQAAQQMPDTSENEQAGHDLSKFVSACAYSALPATEKLLIEWPSESDITYQNLVIIPRLDPPTKKIVRPPIG